jgi:hypothetical protein
LNFGADTSTDKQRLTRVSQPSYLRNYGLM